MKYIKIDRRKKDETAKNINKIGRKVEEDGSEAGKTVKKAMRNKKIWE